MAYDGLIVKRAARLDRETELDLAYRWQEERDEAAMQRLVTEYIPFTLGKVKKMNRAGVQKDDLIQAAMFGLVKAARGFDPSHGIPFISYADMRVRSSIQDCLMRESHIVRKGATKDYKKLFFQMPKLWDQVETAAMARGERLTQHQVCERIADASNISLSYVIEMTQRLSESDHSLNAPLSSEFEGGETWLDALVDTRPQAAELYEEQCGEAYLRDLLTSALKVLDNRELYIVQEYKLQEEKRTFAGLAAELKISAQFVSQIYYRALRKMKKALLSMSLDTALFLTR